ncbi:concanavalin A-like lectin/glucanase [Echria macrotheca]|uniref:chitinase n=1 Tax=Echria macrotheca TaxID=438768 RepID=A0AAJ0BGX3_9PEZI|nr:concanavalin A-like lectin/glucanase [Echria macrotheca]
MFLPSLSTAALLAAAALFQNAAAQVTTDCFPMNKTCPADPALGMDVGFNFNQTPKAGTWDTTVGPVTYSNDGAAFTIKKQGDSPTLRTKFYFFWGRTEIWMKASPGVGVISSVMFLSDNLDEIDWEFKGGNTSSVFSNYFGKGEPDFHNGAEHKVPGAMDDYHNYTTMWTQDALDFYIDGSKVRTLLPKDANNSYYYPQTPMRLSLGIWAGGDPTLPPGTREWAGGDTDYSKGPFSMFVKSVSIHDFSSGKEYVYGDKTGSWQSIKVVAGNSTAKDAITAPPEVPEPSVSEKFNALPPTAKTAIYASAAGVGAVILAFALFYCIRQRRRGAREAKIAEAKAEQERLELERFKKAGVDPDSFVDSATEYNAKDMRQGGMSDANSYSVPVSPNDGMNEKWEKAAAIGAGGAAGAAAAGAMRSPMPLLRDGAQSPRVTSPSTPASGFNTPYTDRSTNARSPGPTIPNIGAVPPPMGAAANPAMRSFSTPNPNMRASPGPQQPGFGGARTNSPAPMVPMATPQPQRSFTSGGYGQSIHQSYGQSPNQGYGNQGYGNQGQPGGQPGQGYWGNGNGGYR